MHEEMLREEVRWVSVMRGHSKDMNNVTNHSGIITVSRHYSILQCRDNLMLNEGLDPSLGDLPA
jgi:hypothetical protein